MNIQDKVSFYQENFNRQMLTMTGISVIAWATFIIFFRSFWSSSYTSDRIIFWIWLVMVTVVFLGVMLGIFHLFKIPPAWRANAAVGLNAPALCLDVLATTYFDSWFPDAAVGDDRIYATLAMGVVGALLLISLLITTPQETT